MASPPPLCKVGDLNRLLSKALFFPKDEEQARKRRDLFGKASGNRWLVWGKKLASQETQVSSLGGEDPLEEKMAVHSLPGKSHGQRSLVGYGSWGPKSQT